MWKKLVLLCLVLATFGWAIARSNDDTRQAIVAAYKPDNANTVLAARQLNEQWESTFDKTGKYPGNQDISVYRGMYRSLTLIPEDDTQNYREARALMMKFADRQPKIDKIEFAKIPKDIDVKLGTLDRSYGLLKGDLTLKNDNVFAVADVKIACNIDAPSGTTLRDFKFAIFDVVPAKSSKTIRGYSFGLWPDQGKTVSCSSEGYQRR